MSFRILHFNLKLVCRFLTSIVINFRSAASNACSRSRVVRYFASDPKSTATLSSRTPKTAAVSPRSCFTAPSRSTDAANLILQLPRTLLTITCAY